MILLSTFFAVAVVEELQRKGIGKSMILDAEKWAKKKGFNYVYLFCSKKVEDFYKKCGYSEVKCGENKCFFNFYFKTI